MEMHQVRYFLATVAELNFTKAAESCHVSQPSLTRAIKQLELELGGDLFRRERPQAQLTELGERMVPLMKQCYESAIGARSLATSIRNGEIGSVRLALSHTIALACVLPFVDELRRLFARFELKLLRGTGAEVFESLKSGEAELAVAADLGEPWERLDRWPLFTESLDLLVPGDHRLAALRQVDVEDLRGERFLRRRCADEAGAATLLGERGVDAGQGHEIDSEADLLALAAAGLGIAFLPRSAEAPATLPRVSLSGIALRRTVSIYGVAGRQRAAAAAAFLKLARSADWSAYES